MHTLVITGGTIAFPFAKQYVDNHIWDRILCADAGMEFCREAGIRPDLILGDFDSAKPDTLDYFRKLCPEKMEQFPAEKDETDTELALLRAISGGADCITVLGATGTRLDHVLGNIQLLKMALDRGVNCMLVDEHNRIRMISEGLVLRRAEQFGKYVSLLPFTPQVTGITLKGFAYEVQDFTLQSGIARGVSNEIAAETAEIVLKEGLLLVIESKD